MGDYVGGGCFCGQNVLFYKKRKRLLLEREMKKVFLLERSEFYRNFMLTNWSMDCYFLTTYFTEKTGLCYKERRYRGLKKDCFIFTNSLGGLFRWNWLDSIEIWKYRRYVNDMSDDNDK